MERYILVYKLRFPPNGVSCLFKVFYYLLYIGFGIVKGNTGGSVPSVN